jgi:hypothetical protein
MLPLTASSYYFPTLPLLIAFFHCFLSFLPRTAYITSHITSRLTRTGSYPCLLSPLTPITSSHCFLPLVTPTAYSLCSPTLLTLIGHSYSLTHCFILLLPLISTTHCYHPTTHPTPTVSTPHTASYSSPLTVFFGLLCPDCFCLLSTRCRVVVCTYS